MGFSWSEQAILQHNNVQQAVDPCCQHMYSLDQAVNSMLSGMGMYSLDQAVNSMLSGMGMYSLDH